MLCHFFYTSLLSSLTIFFYTGRFFFPQRNVCHNHYHYYFSNQKVVHHVFATHISNIFVYIFSIAYSKLIVFFCRFCFSFSHSLIKGDMRVRDVGDWWNSPIFGSHCSALIPKRNVLFKWFICDLFVNIGKIVQVVELLMCAQFAEEWHLSVNQVAIQYESTSAFTMFAWASSKNADGIICAKQ